MNKMLNLSKMGGIMLFLWAFSWNVGAQNITVQGTVVDGFGEPAIGATIQIRGTTQGTVANLDGQFTLSAPQGSILVISYVGYTTVERAASASMHIVLQPDPELLDELVVVGYGVMRRSDLTGSVASARGEDIVRGQSFNALDGLRGRAAGVNIIGNTGQPGGEMRVIIRGISTITASSQPLFVVDGVQMSNLQFLNPNDIESMEVLMDASSTAIFGARGANGVILVTTRRGRDTGGQARIQYSGSISIGTMARRMDVMDSEMWMAAFAEGLDNANRWQNRNFTTDLSQIFTDERLFRNGVPIHNTNWQDEASRTAISHNHNLSITRGSRDHSSGAFFNFTDQQAILLNSYMKRASARFVHDDRPRRWLSTSNNLLVNHAWGNRAHDNPYGMGAMRTMLEMMPFLPVQLDGWYTQSNSASTTGIPTGLYDAVTGAPIMQTYGPENMGNPIEFLRNYHRMHYRTQIFGNTALIFHLTDNLQFRTQYGIEYRINRNEFFTPVDPRPMIGTTPEGRTSRRQENIFYWQQANYLTWMPDFGRHRVTGMAGMEWSALAGRWFAAEQDGFDSNFFGIHWLGRGTVPPVVGSNHQAWQMHSGFTRWTYNFDSRYFATFTARVDGSSRFGANNRYAFFPSVGISWAASNEEFLSDNPIISNLRLRTSYGITGNSEIGSFLSLATMGSTNTILNNQLVPVSFQNRMSNANLRWERTATWDTGLILGLFNDRLNLEGSFYYRYTSDLLLNAPIPNITAFQTMLRNVGAVSNRGVDLMIRALPVVTNDFAWNSVVNVSWNRNRVERLDPMSAVDPLTGKRQILVDGWVGYDMLIREGESLSSFYGFRRAGIFTGDLNQFDPEIHQFDPNAPPIVGQRVLYRNREILGNGLPNWMGSFMNTFSWRGFDMTVDLQFSLGGQIMQEFFHSAEARFLTSGLTQMYTNAWHPERNPTGTGQAIRLGNFGMGQDAGADHTWVANGNFLRGNLIQIGYTLQPRALQNLNLSSLRVYANLNNAFVITHRSFLGFDPDNSTRLGDDWMNTPNNWGAGRQFMSFPRARTITIGLDVTL